MLMPGSWECPQHKITKHRLQDMRVFWMQSRGQKIKGREGGKKRDELGEHIKKVEIKK